MLAGSSPARLVALSHYSPLLSSHRCCHFSWSWWPGSCLGKQVDFSPFFALNYIPPTIHMLPYLLFTLNLMCLFELEVVYNSESSSFLSFRNKLITVSFTRSMSLQLSIRSTLYTRFFSFDLYTCLFSSSLSRNLTETHHVPLSTVLIALTRYLTFLFNNKSTLFCFVCNKSSWHYTEYLLQSYATGSIDGPSGHWLWMALWALWDPWLTLPTSSCCLKLPGQTK